MKKIQPHFEEMLKKLNIISKKQSHMKTWTVSYTFGGLRALYRRIFGRYRICLTKINFQLYMQGNYWKELVLMK